MNALKTIVSGLILGGCVGLLAGCAGGGAGASVGGAQEMRVGEGKQHQLSTADKATTRGSTPIAGAYAKLWVNGMGCPQCVTNIDLQLERQLDATELRVDLEAGVVYARFTKTRPTPDQLNTATEDAGLTLAKIESSDTVYPR